MTPLVALSEIATIIMGQSPPGETYNTTGDGLPFFQGKAEFGNESPTPVKWCSAPSRIAEAGDILLSVRAPVGPTNIASVRCCIGRGLAAIRAKDGLASTRYLSYFFRRFESAISSQGVGSTFTAINRNDIERLRIPLPPLPEQHRLVRLLDEADALRRLRARADARMADFIPALFHEMFGDPARNEKGWDIVQLGQLAPFVTSGSRGWAKHYSLSGPKFIRVQNLFNHHLSFDDIAYVSPPDTSEAKRAKVQPGDILLAITGATIGLSALAPENLGDAYVSQHVAIIRLSDSVDPVYVASFMADRSGGQRQIQQMQYGHTKPGISLNHIRAIKMPIPPLPLQCDFAARVASFDKLRTFQAQSQARLEVLFESMLARAFAGEL